MCNHHRHAPHGRLFALLALTLFTTLALLSGPASARKDGVSGYAGNNGGASCHICHFVGLPGSATVPVVPVPGATLSGPTTVSAGSTNSYTLTLSNGLVAGGDGGFNVATSGGQLAVNSTSDTQLLNNEIAHKQLFLLGPKPVGANGQISWTFNWTAPTVNGAATLYAGVLSGNGDYGFYGDTTVTTTLAVNVSGGSAAPPVANAGGPYSGVVGTAVALSGAASTAPGSSIISYSWDFGDGTTLGTGVAPSHVYSVAGLYTVTLTVMNANGVSATATTTANIGTGTPPPPVLDGNSLYTTNCAGCHQPVATSTKRGRAASTIRNAIVANAGGMGSLSFLNDAELNAIATALGGAADLGGTTPPPPPPPQNPIANTNGPYTGVVGTAVAFSSTGSRDPDGTIASYSWSFGDGTSSTAANPSHTYSAAGLYTVTLTVTDNSGSTGSATTTANIGTGTPPPPDGAALYSANCQGCHGALATSSKRGRAASATRNAINLNTGGMGSLAGLTDAQLNAIATALGGAADLGGTPPPPTAPAANAGGPYTGVVGTAVLFNGGGSTAPGSSISSYAWNFGDGTNGTGANPSHTYTAAGLYTVTLTVTAANGLTGTATTTVNIGTGTPPPPDGAALYGANCQSCHGALATSSKRGRAASAIRNAIVNNAGGMGTTALRALTDAQLNAIATALGGAADLGGTPPPPPPPPPTDGASLYGANCQGCHGALATSSKRGRAASAIRNAINVNAGGMGSLSGLTDAQLNAIATALGGAADLGGTTPPPTGTPGKQLYDAYCIACHGAGGSGGPDGSVRGESASSISSAINGVSEMSSLRGQLTSTQIQQIADYLSGNDGSMVQVGKLKYDTYCSACHGAEGRGGSGGGVRGSSSSEISSAISSERAMQSLRGVLSSTDIRYISDYLNGRSTPLVPAPTPAPPPTGTDGATLYASSCQGCHGALATSSKRGRSASATRNAINANTGGMGTLSGLTDAQLNAIATALGGAADLGGTTPPPPTGTDGAALYGSNCQGCHGALASSSKRGRSASATRNAINGNVGGMGSLSGLTNDQLNAIATALGGAADLTPGGTPPPPTPIPTTGSGLYNMYCLSCHGTRGSGGSGGGVRGASSSEIQSAINSQREMQYLRGVLSSSQIRLISDYLRN